jgi:hypothetical protein
VTLNAPKDLLPGSGKQASLEVIFQVPEYRYMYDRLAHRAQDIERRVEELGEATLRQHGLQQTGVLDGPSQDAITGRPSPFPTQWFLS